MSFTSFNKSIDTRSGIQRIDWVTFSMAVSLIVIGWMMIYAVGFADDQKIELGAFVKSTAGKQLIFIGVSIFLYGFIMVTDWKFWRVFAFAIYAVGIFLLLAVLIVGTKINGARAWFSLGGFLFQPVEVVKFGTSLAISSYLSSYSVSLKNNIHRIYALGIILIPIILINLQPDFGSSLVFLSFFILLYREGFAETPYVMAILSAILFIVSLIYQPVDIVFWLTVLTVSILVANLKVDNIRKYLTLLLLMLGIYYLVNNGYQIAALSVNVAVILGLSLFHYFRGNKRIVSIATLGLIVGSVLSFSSNYVFNNILEPHHQDRINVWLQPEKCDPRGSLYNLLQAKMAIGSGGLLGKGYLQGNMTKLNYVPEQNTDFIFCTIGEEHGFVGTLAVIILYVSLLLRIQFLAERQRSNFSKHYAYCVLGILFIHFFFNIGMTMGLLPTVGIPLPFVSYGGSSLLGFTLLLSVLLKLDSYRYNV